jgi:hypothetical protein
VDFHSLATLGLLALSMEPLEENRTKKTLSYKNVLDWVVPKFHSTTVHYLSLFVVISFVPFGKFKGNMAAGSLAQATIG